MDYDSGLLRSIDLRHQYMETQAFHDLMQESNIYNEFSGHNSNTSSDPGSPFSSTNTLEQRIGWKSDTVHFFVYIILNFPRFYSAFEWPVKNAGNSK